MCIKLDGQCPEYGWKRWNVTHLRLLFDRKYNDDAGTVVAGESGRAVEDDSELGKTAAETLTNDRDGQPKCHYGYDDYGDDDS